MQRSSDNVSHKSPFGKDRFIFSCQKGSLVLFFSFFFFYGDPVQCLVKALSQSQLIASESYHMTSLPKLRLCEKQFQVIYTTAIPLLKEALIFFPSFY